MIYFPLWVMDDEASSLCTIKVEIREIEYEPYYLMPAQPFKIKVTVYDGSGNVSGNV